MPLFTVFTPTYDRAHTLPLVYRSLCAQTDRDFEWLVVDDGSTDGTPALFSGWLAESPFPVRYVRQPNGGKHRAFNRGVREAAGALFAPLDSDDEVLPHGIARLRALWESIPAAERDGFSGVTVLCEDERGAVYGKPFPSDVIDASPVELVARGAYVGDKWGFHRTDVLRRFPFPEFEGERFVPESLVWNRIARAYRMRFVNEVLLRKSYHADGLTQNSVRTRMRSPRGAALGYREMLEGPLPRGYAWRTLVNYVRFMRHAGAPVPEIVRGAPSSRAVAAALPAGLLAAAVDAWRTRERTG